ncbi:iron chaperone [Nocardia mexicana]|uniref:Uncharacterized protein YdhG (YjbR/CyaY superfamily) n=1 Tax=Nocardia mexicana TaxID=279262 RepID=A0A370H9J8_9NOCA|nr:DUF1801 domain-containing protein [Nocardia mexicana]RDI50991.1 uncharacterized protein YdhG (YjbR/CyaY superfamily) [Nocardia mexicana]
MSRYETVDDYIATFPDAVQSVLRQVRRTVSEAIPGGAETISYQVPAVQLDGKAVVYYAGWQQHVSVYPIPAGDPGFTEAIAPYRAGKGTLKFPLSQPVPYELIGRIATLLAEQRAVS